MKDITLHDPQAITQYANQFGASGYFTDAREMAQAFVKISAGMELGFGPFQSMTGIHIIKGKPSVSAGLMASAVKASPKYDYRIVRHTEEVCEIEFRESGEPLKPTSVYSLEDARKAGLLSNPTWKNHPKNMLFARAMSNGVKFHCPDVFGTSVYTPDELGAEVNEDGDIIDTTAVVNEPAPEPKPQPARNGTDWDNDTVFKNAAWIESGKSTDVLNEFCETWGIDDPTKIIEQIKGAPDRARFVSELKTFAATKTEKGGA